MAFSNSNPVFSLLLQHILPFLIWSNTVLHLIHSRIIFQFPQKHSVTLVKSVSLSLADSVFCFNSCSLFFTLCTFFIFYFFFCILQSYLFLKVYFKFYLFQYTPSRYTDPFLYSKCTWHLFWKWTVGCLKRF